jgi:hypothetical protein
MKEGEKRGRKTNFKKWRTKEISRETWWTIKQQTRQTNS